MSSIIFAIIQLTNQNSLSKPVFFLDGPVEFIIYILIVFWLARYAPWAIFCNEYKIQMRISFIVTSDVILVF